MLGRQRIVAHTLIGMGAVSASPGQSSHARELLDEAQQLLTEIARIPQTWIWGGSLGQLYYDLAVAYARLAELDLALHSLQKSVDAGWRDARWLASDPELRPLHAQPIFRTLQESLSSLPKIEFQSSLAASAH